MQLGFQLLLDVNADGHRCNPLLVIVPFQVIQDLLDKYHFRWNTLQKESNHFFPTLTLKARLACSTTKSPSTFVSFRPRYSYEEIIQRESNNKWSIWWTFVVDQSIPNAVTSNLLAKDTLWLKDSPDTATPILHLNTRLQLLKKNVLVRTLPTRWYSPMESRMKEIKASPSP